ncbi:MAG: hypothetical protein KKH94_08685 [Candidatus Omnitrophica bacterium]|nr:hypothetical protein [Candidatus Omnitrophota bacterium]
MASNFSPSSSPSSSGPKLDIFEVEKGERTEKNREPNISPFTSVLHRTYDYHEGTGEGGFYIVDMEVQAQEQESIHADALYYLEKEEAVDEDLRESKLVFILQHVSKCVELLDEAFQYEDEADVLDRENSMLNFHKEALKLNYYLDYSSRFAQFVNVITNMIHEQQTKEYNIQKISIIKVIFDIVRRDIDLCDKNIKEIYRLAHKFSIPLRNPLKDLED